MSKPTKISDLIPKDLKTHIPDQPLTSLQTDWQADEAGNEYKQNEAGVRVYRMRSVDQIKPLRQYFDTELANKHKEARLKDFDVAYHNDLPEIKKYAIGYVKRYQAIQADKKTRGKGYYLYSERPGSGKTFLGCCILAELSRKYEVSTQAITTIDFLSRLKETFDQPGQSEITIINRMLAVDVLLLDECGAERHSDWTEEKFYHLIDSRLNAGKVTFFTSNEQVGKLPYHDRMKSRITAITAQIPMPEKDIRGIAAAEDEQEFLNTIIEE